MEPFQLNGPGLQLPLQVEGPPLLPPTAGAEEEEAAGGDEQEKDHA